MTSLRRRADEDGAERAGGGGVPHRKLILGAVAVVLVAGLATWLVAFSSVLGVRTVQVRGVHTLSADQVRKAAAIDDGTPLVRLDTDGVRHRVEALADVASARVTTSFPSTVTIDVSERVAVGVVQAGGGYLLVDRTGDEFRQVGQRPAHLPLFVVPHGTNARGTAKAVATVAAALPTPLRHRVASIQALDPAAITLLLNNGRVVRWGSADRTAQKARILPVLLRHSGSQFDLTDPDQPFVR